MATEAVTYSNLDNIGANKAFASGLLTSDGTVVNISIGFQPTKIILFNYTAAALDIYTWTKGMTAAYYQLVTGSTGVVTYVTSGGPVVFAGDDDETAGFTIPAALLTDADTWHWEAWR